MIRHVSPKGLRFRQMNIPVTPDDSDGNCTKWCPAKVSLIKKSLLTMPCRFELKSNLFQVLLRVIIEYYKYKCNKLLVRFECEDKSIDLACRLGYWIKMRLTATFNYIKWWYLADRRVADLIRSFPMVSVSLCHLGNFFFWKFWKLISHLNLTILISGKTLFPVLNLVLGFSERQLGSVKGS